MTQLKNIKRPLGKPSSLGARPEFYMVYILFYFVPWLFYPPAYKDAIAALFACTLFALVYLHWIKTSSNAIPHILIFSLIGYLVSPFHGSYGVFHIFAMVVAAQLRPEPKAWAWISGLTLVFAIFSIGTQQNIWDYVFVLVLAIPISIGTMASAEQLEREKILERSRENDQHLAALAERERIARDLHDLLGQTLTMVALKSEVAAKLFDQDPERARQELIEIRGASRTALDEVRTAVAGMNNTTLKRELKRAKQVLTAANIKLVVNGDLPELGKQVNTSLGLALREAVTNIVRHTQASEAIVTIFDQDDNLKILIEDNGGPASIVEGSGLKGLRERIERLGGELDMKQAQGLTLALDIPNWRAQH